MNDQDEFWGKSFRKKEEIVHRSIAGEILLVPIRGTLADMQRIFTLNPVADFIWNQLNGDKTVREIRDEILERFEVTRENAERDIREFIEELIKEDLLAGV